MEKNTVIIIEGDTIQIKVNDVLVFAGQRKSIEDCLEPDENYYSFQCQDDFEPETCRIDVSVKQLFSPKHIRLIWTL